MRSSSKLGILCLLLLFWKLTWFRREDILLIRCHFILLFFHQLISTCWLLKLDSKQIFVGYWEHLKKTPTQYPEVKYCCIREKIHKGARKHSDMLTQCVWKETNGNVDPYPSCTKSWILDTTNHAMHGLNSSYFTKRL